jgi:5-methylcytosine-specific restriction endonuclease McrA
MAQKDLIGQVFGNLTVTKETIYRKYKQVVWECKCDCGNIHLVPRNSLCNGDTKSCGCLKTKNLLGRSFGEWKVLSKINQRSLQGKILWYCKCSCGNTSTLSTNQLTSGKTSSCQKGIHSSLYRHGKSKTKDYNKLVEGKRRANKKHNLTNSITVKELRDRIEFFGNTCVYCQKNPHQHLDHIIPLSKGGAHSIKNLAPSCAKCNLSKASKLLFVEWNPANPHPVMEELYGS